MTVEIADPREPDVACPSAGKTGPPRIDVVDSSSCSLCQSSKASRSESYR